MKFVLKKLVKSELRVLNEREIQERLYGSYRGSTGSTDGQSIGTVESMPKLRFSPPQNLSVWVEWFQPAMARISKGMTSFSTRISPRLAGIVMALILFFTVSFFAISHGFRSNSSTRYKPMMTSTTELVTSELSETLHGTRIDVGSIGAQATLPVSRDSREADLLPMDATEKPADRMSTVYAVQICTYQRESDAIRLTKQLEEMNFKPFYRRMISHQLRTPFYVVFLGQESTYAGAQSLLKQFQKTELFRDFSDSFIRSL